MLVHFKNSIGLKLAGELELPEHAEKLAPAVVFSHGFRSGKDSPRAKPIANKVRQTGMATFLIDFTGHGDSEGSIMDDSTIDQQIDDLKNAINLVEKQPEVDRDSIGVTGASSGGLVALREALNDKRVKAMVLRGPRVDEMLPYAKDFSIPILILVGERDPLLKDVKTFFDALESEKGLEIVSNSGHLFESEEMLSHVVDATARWFEKHLKKRRLDAGEAA